MTHRLASIIIPFTSSQNYVDEDDFTACTHTVQFGESSNVSSTAEITIVDDSLLECTESLICVILRPIRKLVLSVEILTQSLLLLKMTMVNAAHSQYPCAIAMSEIIATIGQSDNNYI